MASLVKTEKALGFTQRLMTKTGRNARLGDPDAFGDVPVAKAILASLNQEVATGVDIVDRLDRDESRTDVQKHHRARNEAMQLNRSINNAIDKLNAIAGERTTAAEAKFDEFLDLDTINPTILGRKMDWVAAQWKDPNGGGMRIANMVKTDRDLAAIMYRADAYLMGIPDAKRIEWGEAGTRAHVPEAYAILSVASRISEITAKLPSVATDIHASFYLEGMAEKMSTRVED